MPLFLHALSPQAPPASHGQVGLRPFEAGGNGQAYAWTAQVFWLAALGLLVFYGLALASWLAAGAVVPDDSKNHFYAMFRFLGDALHNGESPLWNPYHFGGHPAIADPQSLIFTPSMVLFALIAPKASMQLFDAVIFAHLLAGGICILGLFRRWRWHPLGAVLAAIVFMLGGAASARLQHTGIIISYSFFPASLWSLDAALERCSLRCALLFGLCASLMALGRDQVAFLLCIVLAGYLVFAAARSDNALTYLRTRAGLLALSALTILAVMTVPVLLTMQLLADSNRPGFSFGVAAAGSLAPVNLVTLAVPNFFGSLDHHYDYWGPNGYTMPRADFTDPWVDYLFIGTLPFLLIAWHGCAAGRLLARRARFLVLLLLLASLYALGRYTPFFAFAFDWIPGVSLYRRPADATFVVNIALAFAAGYLLHRYICEGLPRPFSELPRWRALALAVVTALAIVALIGSGLAFSLQEGRLMSSLAALAAAGMLAAGGVALFIGLRSPQRRVLAASLLVLMSGAEILWRNAASPLNAEPLERYSVYAGMKPAETAGLEILRKEIAADTRDDNRPRVEMLGLKGPWQNASMVLKLENTLGYNALRIDDYDRAVGTSQNCENLTDRHYPGTFRGYNSRLASLLGLEYLVLDRPSAELPPDIPRPKGEAIYTSGSMYIYKLAKAAPRAYFATVLKPVDDEDVLDEQVLPSFDPAREVLIDEESLADLHGGPYNQSAVRDRVQIASLNHAQGIAGAASQSLRGGQVEPRVAIVKYANDRVEIDVDTPKAGIAVLHDLFYPGWEAFVDGQRETILRANLLFRGVEVPAGHHRVTFSFRPLSLANLKAAAASLLHRGEEE
jgi:hypothetical protein